MAIREENPRFKNEGYLAYLPGIYLFKLPCIGFDRIILISLLNPINFKHIDRKYII